MYKNGSNYNSSIENVKSSRNKTMPMHFTTPAVPTLNYTSLNGKLTPNQSLPISQAQTPISKNNWKKSGNNFNFNSSYSFRPNSHQKSSLTLRFGDDEDINDLKSEYLAQGNIIREYENWVGVLINVINNSSINPQSERNTNDTNGKFVVYSDYATPVQRGLEKIESLEKDNLELRRRLFREAKKNSERDNYILELKSELEVLNKGDRKSVKEEITMLMECINLISDELDFLSKGNQTNKHEIHSPRFDETESEINKLITEMEMLKEEQKELREIERRIN